MTGEAQNLILRLIQNVQSTADLVKTNDMYGLERMGQAMLDIYGKLIDEYADAQKQYHLLSVALTEIEEKTTDATKKAKASDEYRDMVKLEGYIDLTKRQHDYIKKLISNKEAEYARSHD